MSIILLAMVLMLIVFVLSIISPVIVSNQYIYTNEHRWKKVVKPTIGGLFFFISILLWWLWTLFIEQTKHEVFHIISLSVASSISFIVGFLDDKLGTAPLPKLIGQFISAFVLVAGGWVINIFGNFWLDTAFTVIWVVALQNAFNFFDNMDGATGTVSLILFLSVALLPISLIYKVLFLLLSVSILGFLYHNFPPSRIYMGDKGSLLLGLIASIVPILLCNTHCGSFHWFEKLFLFVVIVGLPFIDMILVVIHRICRKTPPWVGGTDHLSHALFSVFNSERKVILIFALIQTLLTTSSGVAILSQSKLLLIVTFFIWGATFMFLFIIHWRYVPEPYRSLCYKHTASRLPSFARNILIQH